MIHLAIWIACFLFLLCLTLSVLGAIGSVIAGCIDAIAMRKRSDKKAITTPTSSIPSPSTEELVRFMNNYSLLSFRQRGIQK